MPKPTTCIDCDVEIPATDVVRPTYRVLANRGKEIRPLPRCAPCRAGYEEKRLAPVGGLEKVEG